MNKHLPVLITLLTFGSFGVVGDDAKDINLLCNLIEGSEINLKPRNMQSKFRLDAVILKINLKKQTLQFNDSNWKYVAISEGPEIFITTKFITKENNMPQDMSELMKHWVTGRIDRQTGILNLTNYSEQNEGKSDFEAALTKKYKCDKYEFKF